MSTGFLNFECLSHVIVCTQLLLVTRRFTWVHTLGLWLGHGALRRWHIDIWINQSSIG